MQVLAPERVEPEQKKLPRHDDDAGGGGVEYFQLPRVSAAGGSVFGGFGFGFSRFSFGSLVFRDSGLDQEVIPGEELADVGGVDAVAVEVWEHGGEVFAHFGVGHGFVVDLFALGNRVERGEDVGEGNVVGVGIH